MMKTISYLPVLCFGIYASSAEGGSCTDYKVLDSEDSFTRSAANSDGTLCDNMLEVGWYRAISKAGERMPTGCIVGGFRCGTVFSIWMNGTYPVINEIKSVTACAADYNGNCCAHSYQIKVKNCTTYLVYQLVPVVPCYQGYCFGSELPCPTGQTSDNGFSPGCELDPCHNSNYKILQGEMKRSSNYTLTINDVAIEDSRLRTGWYRIDSVTGNDIVNYSVSMMQCGTLYPLWMKGSIPDVTDKTVDRKICRSGLTGTCVQEYDIKVRNCGAYRTYYLTQLDVDKSAYCFGTLPVPEPTSTTSTTLTTTTTTTIKPTTTTTTRPTTTTSAKATAPTTKSNSVSSTATKTTEKTPTTTRHVQQTTSALSKTDGKENSAVIIIVLIVLVVVLVTVIILFILLCCRKFKLKPQCLLKRLKQKYKDQSPPTYEETVTSDKMCHPYEEIKTINDPYSSINDNYNHTYDEIPYDTNKTVQENRIYFQNLTVPLDNGQKQMI